MNIYQLTSGNIRHYVAAESREDAYKQGTDPERFPDIHYLPFEIHEIVVPGYTITVTPDEQEAPKNKGGRQRKTEV